MTPAPEPTLPEPREPGRYRIELVCLGNICRSPMAHVVLERRIAEAGLADRVEVTSSGTGDWHIGQPMDNRAAATLTGRGYDATRHRARQFALPGPPGPDLLLVMDRQNLADVLAWVSTSSTTGVVEPERVRLFREFDPDDPGGEVPDPYYGGADGFEEVLAMVERTSDALVAALAGRS